MAGLWRRLSIWLPGIAAAAAAASCPDRFKLYPGIGLTANGRYIGVKYNLTQVITCNSQIGV